MNIDSLYLRIKTHLTFIQIYKNFVASTF